jgi:SPRY domain
MGAIRLLLATTYIAAFTFGRISRIIRHRVAHSSITRLAMGSSTPNEKTDSEIAKQALSDYIDSIRQSMLSYSHHPDLNVIDNNTCIKVSVNIDRTYRGLIWDKSIYKYSVKIDASTRMHIMIGFAPSKLYDINGSNYHSCGWYLYLKDGTLYSQNDINYGKAYSSRCNVGDTITCIYNASASEISFEKNGVSLGVAFTNVNGEDIAPAVELYNKGDSLTLSAISNPY